MNPDFVPDHDEINPSGNDDSFVRQQGNRRANRFRPQRKRRWFLKFVVSSAILFAVGLLATRILDRVWSQVREVLTRLLPDFPEDAYFERIEAASVSSSRSFVSNAPATSSPIDSSSEDDPSVEREGRKLRYEDEYRKYIDGLGLKSIHADDLIRPHRNITRGVENELPPKRYWSRIRKPLEIAEVLQEELGVPLKRINSAYRSPKYNAACPGAATNSYHTRNMALDLVFDCSPKEAARAVKKLRSRGDFTGGLGVYSSFIHIDCRSRNANWGMKV